mmetsp:Transcript_18114/g.41258  ORF Transcript_18114/g.41258 Transcript_18114/m.41258 type:complete len:193 (+) Transcript_18114:503-1081(+)
MQYRPLTTECISLHSSTSTPLYSTSGVPTDDLLTPRMSLSFDNANIEAPSNGGYDSNWADCCNGRVGDSFSYRPPSITPINGTATETAGGGDISQRPAPLCPVSTIYSLGSADSDEEVHVFDRHGQRAPYYDGPYLISSTPGGLRSKKRWYGRLEDGYIAWVSINLFEYFGAVVYQPLNPKGKMYPNFQKPH